MFKPEKFNKLSDSNVEELSSKDKLGDLNENIDKPMDQLVETNEEIEDIDPEDEKVAEKDLRMDLAKKLGVSHEDISDFSEEEELASVLKDGQYFFINKNGEKISEEFDRVGLFSEGFAAVDKNGLWDYINKDGKRLSGEFMFTLAGSFEDGKALVCLNDDYFYIDKNGREVPSSKLDSQEISLPKSA